MAKTASLLGLGKRKKRKKKVRFFSSSSSSSTLNKKKRKTSKLQKLLSHLLPRSDADASQRACTILGADRESVAGSQARARAGSRRVAGETGVQRGASCFFQKLKLMTKKG